jgi:Dolichyl-phosphate-mannose-protein mannosyltransferase
MTPAASANIAAPEGRRPTPVRGVPAPGPAPHGAALPARAGWPERIAVAAIVLFAVALRAHGLSTFPLEQDELYTVDEGTFLLHSELRPGIAARPLYYLLVHPMLVGLPQTPVLLRLLPFLFGIGGVIAVWWLARRTLGRTAGLAAATFVAISPWHLYASGMARYWSLVFLFAALSYALIPRAIDRDDWRAYVPAFLVLLLGSVTHPSFLFPMSGAILGAHLIHADGRLGLRWPTATAWRWLWGPYAVALAAGALVVRSLTHASGLTNWNGRGAAADLRLIPAVVEWATPVMFAAALAGIVLLFRERSPVRRRWALMAGLGIVASLAALIASSTKTNTYADYAMAALPLVLVTAAALPQLIGERTGMADGVHPLSPASRWLLAGGVSAALIAGVLPATVSHLIDGTRFDYRPAYRRITAVAPAELVVTGPIGPPEYYGPGLRLADISADTAALAAKVRQERALWVVASEKRYGLVGDDGGALQAWLLARCHLELVTQRPRLDDRLYRVDLFHCEDH